MDFPVLYKKTSTGADQFWLIKTENNTIVTTWGQVGGAEQTTRDTIAEGKNIGKKNETTPAQQAEAEAQSQFEKKLKKGYVKDINDARAGKVDKIIEGGISPMLAHRYDQHGDKIQWPAFAQFKYDGHRCIGVVKDGKATLWSRTRKPITGVPHINRALEALGKNAIFDGELYNHAYRNNFEELSSFIRQVTPKPGHEAVQYHIYDIADNGVSFSVRNGVLNSWKLQEPLVPVETVLVEDEDALMLAFERFLEEGYEGAIVRNAAGLYVNKRSYDLLKVKEFQDSEFEVVGVEEGRGKLVGHAIFVCKTQDGTLFRAKMKGKTSDLKQYWDNPGLAIGRYLTVKYQGLTNKSEVPRFPVALRFREDL